MAHCSFAIAMTKDFTKENPPWARRLLNIGVRPSFVQELQVSQIADFSAHHTGTFVGETCGMQPYIERYISANIPIWFVWRTPTSFTHHKTRIYCPTEEQVAVARQNPYYSAGKRPPAPALVHSALAQLDAVDVPSATEEPRPSHRPFPPLPLHSHQHVGETLDDFIARSAKKCEEMDQARRQNRERAQATHQLPGKGGPVVFIWENVDGYLIRKRVDRKEVEVEWEDYTDGQRRYNAYYHEWDLAEAFTPEEDAAAEEEEDESLYYSYMGIDDPSVIKLPGPAMDTSPDAPRPSSPALPPVPPALTPQSLPPPNYCDVLALVYDPLNPITSLKGLQPLEIVVYNRYGFTWRDRPIPYDHKTILGHSLPPVEWETTRKI
ncbi:hypothetical protein FIBSPDRAFT_1003618, partial [Athelia psychrophila]